MLQRLGALARKEFIQIIRDRRTLAMMLVLPLLWLVIFGYAFSFDIKEIRVAVIDDSATPIGDLVATALRDYPNFHLVTLADASENGIRTAIQRDEIQMGVVIPPGFGATGETSASPPKMNAIVDGSELFAAQAAARFIPKALEPVQTAIKDQLAADATAKLSASVKSQIGERTATLLSSVPQPLRAQLAAQLSTALDNLATGLTIEPPSPPQMIPTVEMLYNPDLKSATVMIPGLLGMVVMFMGTLMTAIGVVREREHGTLEQLVVTPIRPLELMIGKLVPYFLVAAFDFALVFLLGSYLFNLTFAGNLPVFLLLSLLFELTALGLGLLISTVSENQQQAMQLAIFVIIPQLILSGLIFPLASMPKPIQWFSNLLPFTHFVPIARGMFIKGQDLAFVARPATILCVYAVVVVALATLRFRKRLG